MPLSGYPTLISNGNYRIYTRHEVVLIKRLAIASLIGFWLLFRFHLRPLHKYSMAANPYFNVVSDIVLVLFSMSNYGLS